MHRKARRGGRLGAQNPVPKKLYSFRGYVSFMKGNKTSQKCVLKPGTRVVISGMITNDPRYQEKFAAAARFLRELGCDVFNPAELPPDEEYGWYMERCYEAIRNCDAVYQLDDWGESCGAKLEYMLAVELGKKIIPGAGTVMYICDPVRARACRKEHCYTRVWGSDKLCAMTPNENWARTTYDGKPIFADQASIRDYREGRCV